MRKKTKSNKIWIDRDIYQSEAFCELVKRSKFGVPVLIWFFHSRQFGSKSGAKFGRQSDLPIINNGKIEFTYKTAKKRLGISKPTFSKILSDLVELGFIDQTTLGGGYARECNLFAISERWRNYGKPNFKNVKREKSEHSRMNSGLEQVKRKRENKKK
ncbi:hypothetical protein KJ966_10180 [bacterium]|nr:hypothetical protein [bacterium]